MPDFIKTYSLKLLAVAICPTLAGFGIFCILMAGHFRGPGILVGLASGALFLAMVLLLPLGLVWFGLSRRMPRKHGEPAPDPGDLVEFLPGSAGFIMLVLGVVLSP